MKEQQQLFCTALAVAALLAGCGGGGTAQSSEPRTQSTDCYPPALPAMIGVCAGGARTPDAPANVPCRTPAAPADFKATPPVSPDSECATAA